MPNIATVLKQEVSRLCRREVRASVEPMRKASAAARLQIAALKRKVVELERAQRELQRQSKRSDHATPATDAGPSTRFVAKGLRSLRQRLGISAPELARLIGVSTQSVYNWEAKTSRPGKIHQAAIAALRGSGKREVRQRLEAKVAAGPGKRASRRKVR